MVLVMDGWIDNENENVRRPSRSSNVVRVLYDGPSPFIIMRSNTVLNNIVTIEKIVLDMDKK